MLPPRRWCGSVPLTSRRRACVGASPINNASVAQPTASARGYGWASSGAATPRRMGVREQLGTDIEFLPCSRVALGGKSRAVQHERGLDLRGRLPRRSLRRRSPSLGPVAHEVLGVVGVAVGTPRVRSRCRAGAVGRTEVEAHRLLALREQTRHRGTETLDGRHFPPPLGMTSNPRRGERTAQRSRSAPVSRRADGCSGIARRLPGWTSGQ